MPYPKKESPPVLPPEGLGRSIPTPTWGSIAHMRSASVIQENSDIATSERNRLLLPTSSSVDTQAAISAKFAIFSIACQNTPFNRGVPHGRDDHISDRTYPAVRGGGRDGSRAEPQDRRAPRRWCDRQDRRRRQGRTLGSASDRRPARAGSPR